MSGAPGAGELWAVLPAKCFASAKSRLASVLDVTARAALARAMFEHVFGVVRSCRGVAGTLVVTDGADVALLARAGGAEVLEQPAAPGLGATVESAIAWLGARGADGALVLMADLPRLSGEELGTLVETLAEGVAGIAPDRHDLGTNALALRPLRAFATRFGRPDSLARHVDEARRRGVPLRVHRRPGLALDVDVPDDLRALHAAGGAIRSATPRRVRRSGSGGRG